MNGGSAGLLVTGGTILLSAPDGSIDPASESIQGLFVGDTRLLASWRLRVSGSSYAAVSSEETVNTRTVASLPVVARNATGEVLLVVTQRVSAAGLEQAVVLKNLTNKRTSIVVLLEAATDFADQFMLRSDKHDFDRSGGRTTAEVQGNALDLHYERHHNGRDFAAAVRIESTESPAISITTPANGGLAGGTFQWSMELDPHETRRIEITARARHQLVRTNAIPVPLQDDLTPLRERSLSDLQALSMPCPSHEEYTIVAAGVPWFLTLFGRDSLITSMLAHSDLPGLADGVIRALATTQARADDPEHLGEPGQIVHELRVSELATLRQIPYGRYYGSVDSTPLFLTALAELGSPDLVGELEDSARAAVGWMRGDGGLDEHGVLRYIPDPGGLLHQGWKDSFDAVAHADGRLATGAIALCEAQGYAWRALTDTAVLARTIWDDPGWAQELETVAARLKAEFRERFWMPEFDFPALALDGQGQRVEVIASNAGHLLFSGILDRRDAERVSTRLMEPDMFSGWGLRTLSTEAARYNPTSYHNGSVWPHDTMLAAVGMKAYGFDAAAHTLASAIIAASTAFDFRLPELFGGFSPDRRPGQRPRA
jgi:glycogen debranching enzyme